YACAVNRVIMSELLERQGRTAQAIEEVSSALDIFTELGASIDARNTGARLESLKIRAESGQIEERATMPRTIGQSHNLASSLVSSLDGFIAQRLVQASVSRDLLLHELASIIADLAMSRGALVAEIAGEDQSAFHRLNLKVAASVRLSDRDEAEALSMLA